MQLLANKELNGREYRMAIEVRRLDRLGVASIPSIIHSGGFDVGAQMGVVHPLTSTESGLTGQRVARYKSRHESFRRMLEHLGE